MSGMPPPTPTGFFSGASATTASVVRMFFAIDAAFCSAERVTIVGSPIPLLSRSSTSPVSTLRPQPFSAERTDLRRRPPAGRLAKPLLQLLAVEVGVGVLDLGLQLLDPALDGVGLAGSVDDRRRVLVDDDAAGAAELRELRVLELEAHLLGDHLGAREDRDVLEHPLAAGAQTPGPDRDRPKRAAPLFYDDPRERLAPHVLP